MTILGIDPGTTRAGYGILKKEGNNITFLECGLLSTNIKTHNLRLFNIRKKLVSLLESQKIDRAVVESLFFTKNKKTGLLVAEARGVIMETLTEYNINIIELTPNQIKTTVTGNGNATKNEIKKMLSLFLKTDFSKVLDDKTDAVAAALSGSLNYYPDKK
jgi:crossover junction endodeoxyribonuclease RuvC